MHSIQQAQGMRWPKCQRSQPASPPTIRQLKRPHSRRQALQQPVSSQPLLSRQHAGTPAKGKAGAQPPPSLWVGHAVVQPPQQRRGAVLRDGFGACACRLRSRAACVSVRGGCHVKISALQHTCYE